MLERGQTLLQKELRIFKNIICLNNYAGYAVAFIMMTLDRMTFFRRIHRRNGVTLTEMEGSVQLTSSLR